MPADQPRFPRNEWVRRGRKPVPVGNSHRAQGPLPPLPRWRLWIALAAAELVLLAWPTVSALKQSRYLRRLLRGPALERVAQDPPDAA